MFMEGGNCVTYSLYAPEKLVAGLSYVESYVFLDRWVIAALAHLGINAWYVPINDITSDGGKIGGAAQKRVDLLRRQTGSSRAEVIDTMKQTFINSYGAAETSLSDEDFAAAQHLIDTKYGTEGWAY